MTIKTSRLILCAALATALLSGCQSSDEKVAEYLESAKTLIASKD